MSSIFDYKRLKCEKNFSKVKDILKCFLEDICPPVDLLAKIYGKEKSEILKENIAKFLSTNISQKQIPREHIKNAPNEIFNARSEVEKSDKYQRIHSLLLQNKLPLISDLAFFYGEYSKYVHKIFKIYLDSKLRRKCELSATTHLNRVGSIVFQMGMNADEHFKYSSIAVMHDSIEDLLDVAKFKNGDAIGIIRYDDFIHKYIPEDLKKGIQALTNHYDLIIRRVVSDIQGEDKALSISNVKKYLERLYNKVDSNLKKYVTETLGITDNDDIEEDDLVASLKWVCYKNLYIYNIANISKLSRNLRIFEIKGIDLLDNSHGKDVLSIDSKIKNIIKNTLWGIEGFRIHSDWTPLNNHIIEVFEDALYAAETIILKDLLEPQSNMDFIISALIKFRKLEMIFYK
jgi:hypothetical protein